MKKMLSLILAVLMLASLLAGCGGSSSGNGSTSSENTFSWWLPMGEDTMYWGYNYEDNPTIQRMLQQEFAGEAISLKFQVAPAGTEQDNFNQMLATGEYLDVLDVSLVSQTALELYNEGIILDLTELIQQYMPNYWSHVQNNEILAQYAWTVLDSGEKKMLQIYGFSDAAQDIFTGFEYRRDWIAKYGTNYETGEPFQGGYADPADPFSWQDNIKFPSYYKYRGQEWYDTANLNDGADPITISDWEWMFEIFETAMEDLGITDGYAFQFYNTGFMATGDLYSGFGGGAPGWYYDAETGTACFGGTNDSMKAYLSCLNTWYEKGWLDNEFDQNNDMFFQVDTATVFQGKVGMYMGLQHQMGPGMDLDTPTTDGICIYGCAQPINDVYGTDNEKFQHPDTHYTYETVLSPVAITMAAQDKNLPALLAFIDFMYTEEGSLYKTLGLSDEMVHEMDNEILDQWIPDGNYYVTEENGVKTYHVSDIGAADTSNSTVFQARRIAPGIKKVLNVDQRYDPYFAYSVKLWNQYENTGSVSGAIQNALSTEENKTRNKVDNNLNTYMGQNVPKFIKGELSLDGADWESFCTTVSKYGVNKVLEIFQAKYDALK